MPKATKLSDASPYAKAFDAVELRACMGQVGMTNAQLAALSGYTVRSVQLWVSGERPTPLLVRRVVRSIAYGGTSLNALWCC